jgi:hypothetical protein
MVIQELLMKIFLLLKDDTIGCVDQKIYKSPANFLCS